MELQGSVWGSLLRAYHSEPLDIQRPRVNPLPYYFNRALQVLLCLCFKTSLSAKPFCMRFHFNANQSHFHKNGFALRLA